MTGRPIPAAQLPEVRTRLVDELGRVPNPVLEAYALHATTGLQYVPANPRVTDPVQQAVLLAAAERQRLAKASLYWISPHMTAMTLAAATAMPPFRPTAQDLPSPYGLIYFAQPIADVDITRLPANQIVFDDGTVRELRGGSYHVAAATWGPYDMCGAWRHGGTWFTFYTSLTEADVTDMARQAGVAPSRVLAMAGPLRVDNEIALASVFTGDGEDTLAASCADQGTTAYLMHLVLAAFRLMATSRAVETGEEAASRPARRRAACAGVDRPNEPVRLVDIGGRHRSRTEPASSSGRRYGVRWIVDGHWRNQWYPASEVHRPRWIDAYVKGPEGAPLQVKESVRVWRDPAEPIT